MLRVPTRPVALTIAGSDSGGGAGIQADLKTFAALGVHGASVIACLTAQNPNRVRKVEPVSPRMLRRQLDAVFEALPPRAAKTGMLFSAGNIEAVAGFFGSRRRSARIPLVVDPVMVSTSGARLLAPAAARTLANRLLPLATLVTPNLDEVAALLGGRPATVAEMRAAAREFHRQFGCAVLVKGGHLPGNAAADILFDGATETEFAAGRIRGIPTHGTGCAYSAAICAALALGHPLPQAVAMAKKFVTAAIAGSYRIGKYSSLDCLAAYGRRKRKN